MKSSFVPACALPACALRAGKHAYRYAMRKEGITNPYRRKELFAIPENFD
ncbi:MAG: hypothetical protein AB1632_03125 [Nitrospirota bacterium]